MVFELYAPRQEWVELVGTWIDAPIRLERHDDGWWRGDVPVPDGEHRYRFRLPSRSSFASGEVLEVTDPFAVRIDKGRGEPGTLIMHEGHDVTLHYAWEHDGVPLPPDEDLVVYELHVGEFSARDGHLGTFSDLVDRLDYLVALGVNAIELMPIAAFPGDASWGYNPRHFCAPEESYGSPQDLKRLVDACHARGMRVVLDLVLNHSELEAPLTRIDYDLWFGADPEGTPSFGPKFDYARFDEELGLCPARVFGLRVARYWMQEYHVDGYRLDATALIDNLQFLAELREGVTQDQVKPFWLVAEHIPEDPAVALANGPMDGAWHQAFQNQVLEALLKEDPAGVLHALQPGNHGYHNPQLVANYLESHDEESFLRRLMDAGLDEGAALRKMGLATALLFTAVGVPLIHMGQEFGGIREKSIEVRPLEWEREHGPAGQALLALYRRLARIRHDRPALRTAVLETIAVDGEDGLAMYRRGEGEGEVLVVLTVCDTDVDLRVPFPDGRWRELLTDAEVEVAGGVLAGRLEASGLRIYARA